MDIIQLFIWLIAGIVVATVVVELTLDGKLVQDSNVPSVMITVLGFVVLLTIVVAACAVF